MGRLSYVVAPSEIGPVCQWQVDDKPLTAFNGGKYGGLPLELLGNGIPVETTDTRSVMTLAVCTCGEEGCGALHATLTRQDGMVVLDDWTEDGVPLGSASTPIMIQGAQFDALLAELRQQANAGSLTASK